MFNVDPHSVNNICFFIGHALLAFCYISHLIKW